MEIEIQQSVKAGIRHFLKDTKSVRNLLLNMIIWSAVCMAYQINDYYNNYFPDDNYLDTIYIATVELIGYILGGLLFDYLPKKKSTITFSVSFAICFFGSIWIINNDKDLRPDIDLMCNFVCKFGIASAFQTCFQTNDIFPVVYSSMTFGICYMMQSISSVLSIYVIYTNESFTAWHLFITMCVVGLVCALFQQED